MDFADRDPDVYDTPSKSDATRQRMMVRMDHSISNQHAHFYVAGARVGEYMTHFHDDDGALGHTHEGGQAYPKRADGGYWEEVGPAVEKPPMSEAQAERIDQMLSRIARNPTPPHMLSRWRLRLFCGHLVVQSVRPPSRGRDRGTSSWPRRISAGRALRAPTNEG